MCVANEAADSPASLVFIFNYPLVIREWQRTGQWSGERVLVRQKMLVKLSVIVDQSEWIGENIRVDRLKQVAILIDAEPKGLVDQSVRDGFCRNKLFVLMGQELIERVGECHDQ
jgi:hypothetical protein